ncbi:hypothetical protein HEP84_50950 [Streptomyces sp. RLB1-33]|nr:hypothetical protein [Streptomyces sp. RLB1-33]QIY76031.1 hypothetical protein HEP84_50950 [Streptomyces sp. RLB1-33]
MTDVRAQVASALAPSARPWALSALVLLVQAALTDWLIRRGVDSRWAHGRVGGSLPGPALVRGAGARTALLVVGFGLGGSSASVAFTVVAELAPPARRGGAFGT